MLRTAIALSLCLVAAATSGCKANGEGGCSGCDSNHIWGTTEVAADLESNLFPPGAKRRDHLYEVHCRITHGGDGAACEGVRSMGLHPHRRVTVHMLLRSDGSFEVICWPDPSSLCAPGQVKEQRAHPLIPGSTS